MSHFKLAAAPDKAGAPRRERRDLRASVPVAQRWVNVEFLWGPRDGEVHVYPYPPPRELCVPLRPLTGEWISGPAWVPPAGWPMVRTGRYRATDDDDCEIVPVTDSRWGRLRSIMGGRRPLIYFWQGEF